MIPPIKPTPRPVITTASSDPPVINRKEVASIASESPVTNRREKRMSVDLGRGGAKTISQIDGLQEENENILEKLRVAEERCEEAESRPRQRERQVASRTNSRNNDVKSEEIVTLHMEAKAARNDALSTVEHLQEAESELRTLRSIAQRMILNQEQMEEVVLKRCWLARYWKLCIQHA